MSKEKRAGSKAANDDELLPVMLEPHEGKSDQEVLDWLQQRRVDAEILAERFISANIPSKLISAAEQIAYVSKKPRKQQR